MTLEERERELIFLVGIWRATPCKTGAKGASYGEDCNGENHQLDCPVEIARQDLFAAHDKLLIERRIAGR